MQLSFLSERVNAIRASWASRRPGSLRAKKKKKRRGKRSLAGTSGRRDTSSSVLIAANACGMQQRRSAEFHMYVIMAAFVPAIVVVVAPVAMHILPCRCEPGSICVCFGHASVCKFSNKT